ncbi:PIN domain-containing protein [Nostoc sp. CHAB 5844]|nr:PIN domain-containing protein [Nostoc sp. CHAB 5844]
MKGRVLIDTNILVYVYDPLHTTKQAQAIAVTDRLIRSGKAVISTQVMGEFFIATTRPRRSLLTSAEALERMRNYLAACHVVEITRLITLEAIRGVETHHFQFWDAQIWATARLNQIEEIYSEDFASGSMVEGVHFSNPFMGGL